jgi:rubrerythrin
MTNEKLIAKARELCEAQVAYWQNVVNQLTASPNDGHAKSQLNSWTTHLAEMDEHEKNRFIDPTSYSEKWICKVCGKDCPCNFLITKAKQFLGVSIYLVVQK